MEKSFSRKDSVNWFPKLIIIEGFWGVGKSRLIQHIRNKIECIFIPEPDHIIKKIKKNISQWYFKQHSARLKQAGRKIKNGKTVLLERSIISSIAFNYAVNSKISKNNFDKIKKLLNFQNPLIIFLYGNKNFIKQRALNLRDYSVKNQILKNRSFCKNYLAFYKKILPPLIKNRIIFINVASKEKPLNFKRITLNLWRKTGHIK